MSGPKQFDKSQVGASSGGDGGDGAGEGGPSFEHRAAAHSIPIPQVPILTLIVPLSPQSLPQEFLISQ